METGPFGIKNTYRLNYDEGDFSLEREVNNSLTDSGIQHIVLEGETLQSISFKYYKNSDRWSDIADYNAIIDPLDLNKCDILIIPN